MFNKIYYNFVLMIFFTALPLQMAHAQDQDQQSFPFDDACLKYDKANFKVGQALLDVMTAGDFPQYCVLYSLSNYQVKQQRDDGYFIIGSKVGLQHAENTVVFLKSSHRDLSTSVGQWAYFTGMERFMMDNGGEEEFYVFQEIDL